MFSLYANCFIVHWTERKVVTTSIPLLTLAAKLSKASEKICPAIYFSPAEVLKLMPALIRDSDAAPTPTQPCFNLGAKHKER